MIAPDERSADTLAFAANYVALTTVARRLHLQEKLHMDNTQLMQIGAALVGGGAMGAVITATVTHFRNRVQPIGYRIQYLKVFQGTVGSSSLQAHLKISDGQRVCNFDNLFIAEIDLDNKGNKDFDSFTFGMTLSRSNRAFFVEAGSPDRHHIVQQNTPVQLQSQVSDLDFTLKPFNRGDRYSFKVFLTVASAQDTPKPPRLSSPHSVKFVETPTMREVLRVVWYGAAKPMIIR